MHVTFFSTELGQIVWSLEIILIIAYNCNICPNFNYYQYRKKEKNKNKVSPKLIFNR